MNSNFNSTSFFSGFRGIRVKNLEESNFLLTCSKQKGFIVHEFDIKAFEIYPIYYINMYNAKLEAVKNITTLLFIKLKLQSWMIKRSFDFFWINIADELPDKVESAFDYLQRHLFSSENRERQMEVSTFRTVILTIGLMIASILFILVVSHIIYRVIFGYWFIVELLKELK